MKKRKLIVDYTRLADVKINFVAQRVVTALTGNSFFPTTLPSLENFTIIKENYSESLTKAATGDKNAIVIKRKAKEDLIAAMRQLATDIEAQANGSETKLVSSGFDLASAGGSSHPITEPKNFKISEGKNPGEIKMSVKRVANAVSYIHEYTDSEILEEGKWISKVSTSREHVFTGIRSGIRIYGRTKVVGRKGQEVNSVVLTRVVQ